MICICKISDAKLVKEQVGFIEKPMRRGLQIATDDVVPSYVIGEADARAVATSNIVPLLVPCALTLVVVEPGCYGWTRPRSKLREDTPEPAPVSGEIRDSRHPWRARTWTWTLSSCRSSAAWAQRTKTSSFRSFRDCWASSSTQPAAPSSWT